MIRNLTNEPRALSLPPLSELPLVESPENDSLKTKAQYTSADSSRPLKITSEFGVNHRPENFEDLGISEGMFQGCSDSDLYSPANADANCANLCYTKHSPSECGSAMTDEDSGCHLQYCHGSTRSVHKDKLLRASSFSALESRSIHGFGTRDEFITAMTEDLSDWLTRLYPDMTAEIEAENFFDRLSDGVLLCHHATEIHHRLQPNFPKASGEFRLQDVRIGGVKLKIPTAPPCFQLRGLSLNNSAGSSFWARDNIASFLKWCREMHFPDSILFETEDLVSRKNVRSVIVCLLELARLGGRLGMEVPDIIYLEKEIDDEIAADALSFNMCDNQRSALGFYSFELPESTCDLENEADNYKCSPDSRLKTDSISCSAVPSMREERTDSDGLIQVGRRIAVNKVSNNSNQTDDERSQSKLPRHIYNKAAILRSAKIRSDHPAQKQKEIHKREEELHAKSRYNRPVVDMRSLDEMVRDILSQCTCEQTFPMVRLSEGRYLFGDKSTQIFVRILRSHVMVRVGGGWDTLNHFLQKYDECRKVPQTDSENMRIHQSRRQSEVVENLSSRHILNSISTAPSQLQLFERTSYLQAGAIVGQGSLQVVKKGREIIRNYDANPRTTSHIISQCTNSNHQFIETNLSENDASSNSLAIEKESSDELKNYKKMDDADVFLQSYELEKSNLDSNYKSHEKLSGFSSPDKISTANDISSPSGSAVSNKMIPQSHFGQYKRSITLASPNSLYSSKTKLNRTLNTDEQPRGGLSSSTLSLGNLSDISLTKRNYSKKIESNCRVVDGNALNRAIFSKKPNLTEAQRTRSVSNLIAISSRTKTSNNELTKPQNSPDVFTRLSARPSNKLSVVRKDIAISSSKQRAKSISSFTKDARKNVIQNNSLKEHTPKSKDVELKRDSPSKIPEFEKVRQKSVARMPAEGTRIPRPSDKILPRTSRSKSFSSQFLMNT